MNYVDRNFDQLLNTLKGKEESLVFEEIKNRFDQIPEENKKGLEEYFARFAYWGKLNRARGEYEEIHYRAHALSENLESYRFLYDHLGDYRSKKLLFAILNNWYCYDFITLKEMVETAYCDYFDLDLVQGNEQTVLVDLGAYTGDTVLQYLATYGKNCYKKIYCYEITEEIFTILQKNLAIYPHIECRLKAASDKSGKIFVQHNLTDFSANTTSQSGQYEIKTGRIDDEVKEPITILKMDIEGNEQQALKGCQNHIKEDHPLLLISVYHHHEDLAKIPQMIEEYCPGYCFYLRNHGGPFFPTEITLVGIYQN